MVHPILPSGDTQLNEKHLIWYGSELNLGGGGEGGG